MNNTWTKKSHPKEEQSKIVHSCVINPLQDDSG